MASTMAATVRMNSTDTLACGAVGNADLCRRERRGECACRDSGVALIEQHLAEDPIAIEVVLAFVHDGEIRADVEHRRGPRRRFGPGVQIIIDCDREVVGELKVPGFSTFLVPIDADHLLAVGQYIPDGGFFFSSGVQLSIFDVSDFANPKLTANVVLGAESGASSEALFNPKAFTYFADRNLVALPVSIFEDSPSSKRVLIRPSSVNPFSTDRL